jgi:hypothetical protein
MRQADNARCQIFQGVPEYADWVDVKNLISDVNATVSL